MRTQSILSTLVASALLLSTTSAWTRPVAPFDGQQVPVTLVPDTYSVDAGSSLGFQVTLSTTSSSDQTVDISSNSPLISVPAHVTVPAGQRTVAFYADATDDSMPMNGFPSSLATITATCNNTSKSVDVTVVY